MTAEITPETLRLASNGAGILEFYCRLPEAKAVWELVAHATETCEWTENESDECWDTACGEKYILTTGDGPLKHGFNFCHHCGLKLTETPRPATTGEGMGEG